LDVGHASRYYIRRRNGSEKAWQTVAYSRYAKLEAAFDCDTHLLVGALVGRGPRVDTDRFVPLLDAALANVRAGSALADAGYDSEANHVHARGPDSVVGRRRVLAVPVPEQEGAPPIPEWAWAEAARARGW
jgi:hypothetical protein